MTRRQARILEFIVDFRKANGFSPTYREIGDGLGISSPNGVVCHVRALIQKGKLTKTEECSRSLIPTENTAERLIETLLEGIDRGRIRSVAGVRRHLLPWRSLTAGRSMDNLERQRIASDDEHQN